MAGYTPNDNGMYSVPLTAVGRRLRDNFGLRIVEHPEFGGVSKGVHAPNSYHDFGEAIDIQDWRADNINGVDWKTRTANLARLLQGSGPEVLGPGVKGHNTHLHLAATNGMLNLNENQYQYLFGGNSGGAQSTFTGYAATGDPATPSGAADIEAPPVLSPQQVNAKYDEMRMAGDVFKAQEFGMEQHKRLFNKQ